MNTTQRGFIPLAVIVILGIIGITGGTIAIVSNSNSDVIDSDQSEVLIQEDTISEDVSKEPVVDVSTNTVEQPEAFLEQPEHQKTKVTVDTQKTLEINQEVLHVCNKINEDGSNQNYYLVEEVQESCEKINSQEFYETSELSKHEMEILEKWTLLTLSNDESKYFDNEEEEERDIYIPKVVTEKEEEHEYDDEQCLVDKEKLVGNADQDYLQWYDDWQKERYTLDSCYNTEPTPYCDKKMTEINVEWQEKLKEIMSGYYDQLDSCRDSDKHFHDVSEYISSSY